MTIYREINVDSISDIETLINECKKSSIIKARVKREIYDMVDRSLRFEMMIQTIESVEKDYITIYVAYPENLVLTDKNIQYKSRLLSDPEVIIYLMETSTFKTTTTCNDIHDITTKFQSTCSQSPRFIIAKPESDIGYGYIVCGGTHGVIHAVVFDEALTHLGIEAIRYLFFNLPFTLFIYDINLK